MRELGARVGMRAQSLTLTSRPNSRSMTRCLRSSNRELLRRMSALVSRYTIRLRPFASALRLFLGVHRRGSEVAINCCSNERSPGSSRARKRMRRRWRSLKDAREALPRLRHHRPLWLSTCGRQSRLGWLRSRPPTIPGVIVGCVSSTRRPTCSWLIRGSGGERDTMIVRDYRGGGTSPPSGTTRPWIWRPPSAIGCSLSPTVSRGTDWLRQTDCPGMECLRRCRAPARHVRASSDRDERMRQFSSHRRGRADRMPANRRDDGAAGARSTQRCRRTSSG